MILRRLRLVPTLITIAIVAICGALGVWQLQRLQWKEGLIAAREAAISAPAVSPPSSLAEARTMEFHRVVAEGVFLHDKELFLGATSRHGGEAGFDVFTPLRTPDGRTIFVNRGFVPTALKDRAARRAGEVGGSVRVAGLLRLGPDKKPGWFLPDNRADINYWFWVDLPTMAAADGLGQVAPFYIAADASPNPGGWPQGGVTPIALPNNHLQYAITWFALAAGMLVVYIVSLREGRRSV